MDERGHVVQDVWLSGVLGTTAWRVIIDDVLASGSGPEVDAARVELAAVLAVPGFVFAKVPASDVAAGGLLEDAGFRLVDAALTFAADAGGIRGREVPHEVRDARPTDEDAVTALAGRSFRFDRFHADPAFAPGVADRVKSEWARAFFRDGRGDAMVVACDEGAPIGFLQMMRSGDEIVIDLVAVEEERRGRGVLAGMLAYALGAVPGIARVTVGTQLANTPSIAAYQRLGFSLVRGTYVFHHHGREAPA